MSESSKSISEQFLLAFFSFLALQGTISGLIGENFFIIDPTTQLEICFFIFGILNFSPTTHKNLLVFIGFSTLALASILLSMNFGTPLYEATRAVKWLFYLSVIWAAAPKIRINMETLFRIYKIVISCAIVSYSIQIIRAGFEARPILFTENNYEISFFAGLYTILLFHSRVIQKPLKIRWYIALNVVIGLSGSRSGAVAGLLVAFYFFNKTMTKKSMLILRLGISGLAFLALLLTFLRRGSSITQTDRFLFYEVFLSETKEKEFYSWLFGNIVIRPLSEFGCNRLNYYQILISDHTFGTCYSVILHSFVLRILWDFGIFGLIISFLAIFSRLNGLLPKPMPQIFVFLALINAASVSGPNNVYVVFPILLAILAANNLGSSKRNLKFPTEKF